MAYNIKQGLGIWRHEDAKGFLEFELTPTEVLFDGWIVGSFGIDGWCIDEVGRINFGNMYYAKEITQTSMIFGIDDSDQSWEYKFNRVILI